MKNAVVTEVFATVGYIIIYQLKLLFLNISLGYKHLNI